MANSGNAMGYAVANTRRTMPQSPRSITQPVTNSGNAVGYAVANVRNYISKSMDGSKNRMRPVDYLS